MWFNYTLINPFQLSLLHGSFLNMNILRSFRIVVEFWDPVSFNVIDLFALVQFFQIWPTFPSLQLFQADFPMFLIKPHNFLFFDTEFRLDPLGDTILIDTPFEREYFIGQLKTANREYSIRKHTCRVLCSIFISSFFTIQILIDSKLNFGKETLSWMTPCRIANKHFLR